MPQSAQHTPSVRVNIRAVVNNAMIRREKRNGKEYIIVPSATLPDDVVMNGIKYPASEIEKSYQTLDRTFAPLGHPKIGDMYVSASEPEAINDYYIGAHNENVRRENGRVFLDKAIDVEVAGRTEKGRQLLDAINKGEPIHTSTGVFLETDDSTDPGYSKIAKNMYFDHDAILIGEEGAATPSQGVGVFVNSADQPQSCVRVGDKNTILTINSVVPNSCDAYDCDVEWAAKHLIETIERAEKAKKTRSMLDKFIALVRDVMTGSTGDEEPKASGLDQLNGNEDPKMPITDEQFKALSDKVDALATNAENIAKTVAEAVAQAVKPLTDDLAGLKANEKAKEDAERVDLVAKVVANGLLTEAVATTLATNALRELAAKTVTQPAAPFFAGNANAPSADAANDWDKYDLSQGEK